MPNKISISDMLMIGFDHKEGDNPTLVVGRVDPATKEATILNIVHGVRAEQIYNDLLHGMSIASTKELDNAEDHS